MVINIYGVGRSGTKAIQLYLAYLLAEKFGQVRLNYEPYFWLTRSGPVNFEGLEYHLEAPQFCREPNAFTAAHRKYLTQLTSSDGIPVITKFIRANGRIPAIEAIMQPDHSILVVRDLYDVLVSLQRMDWDFFSVGYSYFKRSHVDYWKQIKNYLARIQDFPWQKELDTFNHDRLLKNACYWYAMNRAALAELPEDGLVMNYGNLKQLEQWAATTFFPGQTELPALSDARFIGEKIHGQYPLTNETSPALSVWFQRWNEMRFYLTKSGHFSWLPKAKSNVGNIVRLATSRESSESKKASKVRVKVSSHPILDYFQKDIQERLLQYS